MNLHRECFEILMEIVGISPGIIEMHVEIVEFVRGIIEIPLEILEFCTRDS